MRCLRIVILVSLAVILSFSQCKKNDGSWTMCYDCSLDEWIGEYNGYGDYFELANGTELDVPVKVTITKISENSLEVVVDATDKLSTSFISSKNELTPYFDISGSDKSLNLTLSSKGNDYKLSGTVKIYYKSNPENVDKSISFDTFR